MERSQTQSSMRPPSSKLSPLTQHPITPVLSNFPQDATQAIFLNDPAARLSSSPASSPRIIDPEVSRRISVHPAMSDSMEKGLDPGADFFDDDSSDSGWEDSEGDISQTFSEVGRHERKSLVHGTMDPSDDKSGGRSRETISLTALPRFDRFSSGLGEMHKPVERRSTPNLRGHSATKTAREMSLRGPHKDHVQVFHSRSVSSTPRDTVCSNGFSDGGPFPDFFKPLRGRSMSAGPPESSSHRRHRRNASGSVIAGSIINAHNMTMRALESLHESSSSIRTKSSNHMLPFPQLSSFSSSRHITLPPLRTVSADRKQFRPAHSPDHFIKTPYPFTAKKEFPKPQSRPRQRGRPDSGYSEKAQHGHDDRKGKHVLGLPTSGGRHDLRSRLQRNEDAQGVVRSRGDEDREKTESVVWMSLERSAILGRSAGQVITKLEKMVIPSSLVANNPDVDGKKGESVDFDDQFFAKRLRKSHSRLAGPWLKRLLSARTLQTIRLARLSTWSGSSPPSTHCTTAGLLAAGSGIDLDADTRSPFTEEQLVNLYRRPSRGKARYTWVHWAHRISASNTPAQPPQHPPNRSQWRCTRSLDAHRDKTDPTFDVSEMTPLSHTPESIVTIQFMHTLSSARVMFVVMMVLLASMLAALAWVFFGADGTGLRAVESTQRSDRVGSAMAIGMLALLLQSVGFGAWIMLS